MVAPRSQRPLAFSTKEGGVFAAINGIIGFADDLVEGMKNKMSGGVSSSEVAGPGATEEGQKRGLFGFGRAREQEPQIEAPHEKVALGGNALKAKQREEMASQRSQAGTIDSFFTEVDPAALFNDLPAPTFGRGAPMAQVGRGGGHGQG